MQFADDHRADGLIIAAPVNTSDERIATPSLALNGNAMPDETSSKTPSASAPSVNEYEQRALEF